MWERCPNIKLSENLSDRIWIHETHQEINLDSKRWSTRTSSKAAGFTRINLIQTKGMFSLVEGFKPWVFQEREVFQGSTEYYSKPTKAFDALDWLALLVTQIPSKAEQADFDLIEARAKTETR